MKIVLVFLLFPVLCVGQTVHVKEDKIVYEGKEKMEGHDLFNRIQQLLPTIMERYQVEGQSENSIRARGELRLNTPHHLIRTVAYSININLFEGGYQYQIDSVSFTEKERGGKAATKSSKDVVKDMEETGKIVGDTEKILNETDMRFQKLLAVLRREIKEG